jgi:hypothetical protein
MEPATFSRKRAKPHRLSDGRPLRANGSELMDSSLQRLEFSRGSVRLYIIPPFAKGAKDGAPSVCRGRAKAGLSTGVAAATFAREDETFYCTHYPTQANGGLPPQRAKIARRGPRRLEWGTKRISSDGDFLSHISEARCGAPRNMKRALRRIHGTRMKDCFHLAYEWFS